MWLALPRARVQIFLNLSLVLRLLMQVRISTWPITERHGRVEAGTMTIQAAPEAAPFLPCVWLAGYGYQSCVWMAESSSARGWSSSPFASLFLP
jgi:hypothetical protein